MAERAFEQPTGRLWEHETAISDELGSNVTAWGDAGPAGAGVTGREGWLELSLGYEGRAEPPSGYLAGLHEVVSAVAEDPAWQRWWAASGLVTCELWLFLDGTGETPPGSTVRKGRKKLRVDVSRDPGSFPSREPAVLFERAVEQVRDLLDRAREGAGLGPLPGLPVLSDELTSAFADPAGDEAGFDGDFDALLAKAMRGETLTAQDFGRHRRARGDATP